jgi:hypothetical protein
MRIKFTASVCAIALAASAVIAVSPANAQWRGYGYHGYNGYYGYHRGYDDDGGALAGLAAGAILGGILASQRPYYGGGRTVGSCQSRFRSYDPGSGTYLGYDGYRHSCP